MLQPGDVLVVDLFGKEEGGTIVGDNLFYYIMKATKTGGLVVDGGDPRPRRHLARWTCRRIFGSASERHRQRDIDRDQHPGAHRQRDGDAGRPGLRRPRGRVFHSARARQKVVDNADEMHVHDEWTRKKFDEGKYKSSEIYGTPEGPGAEEGIPRILQEAARGDSKEESPVVRLLARCRQRPGASAQNGVARGAPGMAQRSSGGGGRLRVGWR